MTIKTRQKGSPKLNAESLAKLSKEQKLKLLDLIEEKKRRARARPETFVPNEGQIKVLSSGAIERYVFAGNGSGKTALLAQAVLAAANGFDPWRKVYTKVPCRIVVVLDKPEKVEEVWLPELKKWSTITPEQLHKRGKPYVSKITWTNGSSLTFMFFDQEDMSFESIEADFFVFDEPPPRRHYVALKRGGRTKGGQARYLMGGTPLAAPWLRTEVYEPWARGERPNTECFRFGTEVNRKNLADGYIEQFSAVLSEKEKAIRLEGNFFDIEGLALAHLFKRKTHVVSDAIRETFKERGWPCVAAVDPHPNKPTCAVLLGADRNERLIVLGEISLKVVPSKFAEELKKFTQGFRIVDWVCDNFGSADFTGGEGFASFIEILNRNGIRIRPTRYDEKQDTAFISRIQEVLHCPQGTDNLGAPLAPKLQVVESCRGLISDIENVEWVKYRDLDIYKPKLNIANKDFLACLKYALATNLVHSKSRATIIKVKGPVSWGQR
jgi:hypothetical protein